MDIHIFTTNEQPATDWVDHNTDPPIKGGYPPHKRTWCNTCKANREMRNLVVKLYYDTTHFFCKEGHKHPGGDQRRKLVHR